MATLKFDQALDYSGKRTHMHPGMDSGTTVQLLWVQDMIRQVVWTEKKWAELIKMCHMQIEEHQSWSLCSCFILISQGIFAA